MDYQKMYTTLFNAITDALSQIETQNYGDAKETLISAQQKAEEIYITAENLLKSQAQIKKSYRQKKSIAKQRRQSGSLGRLK